VVQCIQRLKTERKQLQDQLDAAEECVDQLRTKNTELTTELSSLRNVREQLQAMTACNVRHLAYWCHSMVACFRSCVQCFETVKQFNDKFYSSPEHTVYRPIPRVAQNKRPELSVTITAHILYGAKFPLTHL